MAKATKAEVLKLMDRIEGDIVKLTGMIYEACPGWPHSAATNDKDGEVAKGLNALTGCMMGRYLELLRTRNRSLQDLNDRLAELVAPASLEFGAGFMLESRRRSKDNGKLDRGRAGQYLIQARQGRPVSLTLVSLAVVGRRFRGHSGLSVPSPTGNCLR
jgi:hypothetical protein